MPIKTTLFEKGRSRVPVKVWTDEIEPQAADQLLNLSTMPFIHHHVAAMPDVHLGRGATIGSVIATKEALIPAAVGVDIGCGMEAVMTDLTAEDLPDSLREIRLSLEKAIPVGFNEHEEVAADSPLTPELIRILCRIVGKHPGIRQRTPGKYLHQVGTLGGGNHFIELCLDQAGSVWVMLHSGSRNIGAVIADYFITKAKQNMERFYVTLPDTDLAFLPSGTQDARDYVEAVMWAQNYARINRQAMMSLVFNVLEGHFQAPQTVFNRTDGVVKAISCHHNYVARESHYGSNVWVTRKGAIRARTGDLGIIPGSMGTGSFIVRGLGNVESFHSCSHGAGRAMSRTEAKRRFTVEDLEEQTRGVEGRKDEGVIDEIPKSYKDLTEVMSNQTDLVSVVAELRTILYVKG